MKRFEKVVLAAMIIGGSIAGAAELKDVCKAECPNAKDEVEVVKCMEALSLKKKGDRNFRKTDCFAAVKEHSKHGAESDHGHAH